MGFRVPRELTKTGLADATAKPSAAGARALLLGLLLTSPWASSGPVRPARALRGYRIA